MNNESKSFTVPAILSRIAFTKDRGLTLGFSTNELADQEKVAIAAFHGNFGWLAFRENAVDLSDLPTEDAEDKSKTPSKRLRAVLFILAKQKGIKDFEPFYRESVEKIIEQIKAKLD